MTSRRPMTRSYSGNGRSSSFSEEESSSSSNGRNTYLSNVRPENSYSRYSHYRPTRSTLCSVMAQLTEDVQPSFETTLKSKAVSENCNVKFTCVVSGYPAPELKWYKDDMEMDRYCGLPKYEIRRNGKTHTLHIYNCTLDDAAIYQVSASNSKGIVSCSGVLEVGTMSEYQIHQRFFAKLKAKAEKKKQDLDDSSKKDTGDKEPIQKETPQKSPERPPRKRPIPQPKEGPEEPPVGTADMDNQNAVQEPVPASPVAPEVNDSENALVKKKIKISNGMDAQTDQPSTPKSASVRNSLTNNGGDNHYDGGMGLAQFLAETLQTQAADEKQVANKEEAAKSVESVNEKVHEENSKQNVDKEMEQDTLQGHERVDQEVKEESKENSQPTPPSRHEAKVHSRGHKEHKEHKEHKDHKDHKDHHVPAALSSMLHTVKDFFFGKSKKDSVEYKQRDHSESPNIPESTPPSFYLQTESRSETKIKDDNGMSVEDTQLQEATQERSQVAEEQEDMCSAETVVESLGHGTAGGGVDQAMEVTAEETPFSSPHLFVEMVGEDDRLLNHSDIKSDDGSALPLKDSRAPSEQPTVYTQPGVEPACAPSFQRHHIQNSCEDSTDSSLQPKETRDHNHAFESQPQRTQKDTCTSDLTSAQEEDKTVPCQSNNTPLVPDRQVNSEQSVEQEALSVVQEMNVEFPTVVNDSTLSTQCLPVINQESNKWNISESANEVQEKENNENHEESRDIQIPRENIPLIQISTIEDTQDTEAAAQIVEFGENVEDNSESLPAAKPLMTGIENEMKTLPEFHICSTEDIPEIQAVIPVICIEDEILCPTIVVSQPEVKEGPTPLPLLPQEKESDISHKEFNNWPNIIIQNDYVSDFCVQNDLEKAGIVSQADELPQVNYPIPIINVSCTEEAIEQASDMSPSSDTAALPVFVTPPITEMPEHRDTTEQKELTEQKEITEPRETTEPKEITEPRETTEPKEITEPRKTTEPKEMTEPREMNEHTETTVTEHRDTLAQIETREHREMSTTEQMAEMAEFRQTTKHKETFENGESPEQRETAEQKATSVTEDREPEAASQEETKQNNDKQSQGEQAEQNVVENKLTLGYETPKTDVNALALSKTVEASIENEITQSLKEARIESFMSVERLSFKPPLYPSLSPASLRKFMSKASGEADAAADRQSDKAEDSLSGGSTPTSSLSCESSPRLKRRDSLSLIRSATPEELASGARRKIFIPKTKEDSEDSSNKKDSPYMSPGQARRTAFLQPPNGPNTPPVERRSPLLNRRKATLEVPKVVEEIPVPEEISTKREDKSGDKKPDPLKAPQVIRKIRGEPFPDASGHLKLWCQFFNVLSDSTIKWYKEEQEILEVQKSGGDESQVALAIVLASSVDCGVYGCTIKNEYGSDTTDFLLSEDVMAEILLKDDLEVGEEIEMTPLLFNKGLADSGTWGGKFFGRIMTETVHLGEGWTHKASRVKAIYGLEPIFESGTSCIMKIQNPIPYGTKLESNLAERNQEITKQECKVQNMIREYCKIFTAEARVNENFGSSLEVVSQYLMYRPANSVPYATVEPELQGPFQAYCWMDTAGKLNSKSGSEVELKCCTFQHWLYEWTHSNLLPTRLEGVDFKLTNVRVVTKSKGYQGLSERSSPEVFDQFLSHHQCNYYCGLMGLRPLKSMDSLQPPSKMKGSRSPMLNRKMSVGSGSPHMQKKASLSPHSQRKTGTSPKVPRKSQEAEDSNSTGKGRAADSR